MGELLFQHNIDSQKQPETIPEFFRRIGKVHISSIFFWFYNIVYFFFCFVFVLFFFTNVDAGKPSLIELLTLGGNFPIQVLLTFYAILLMPFISVTLALFTNIKGNRQKISKLFFGFQIPLMGLMVLRIVFLRQVTPVVWLLMFGIFVSVIGHLYLLYKPTINSKLKLFFVLVTQQLALVIAGYAFILAFFFLPIFIAVFLKNFSDIGWLINNLLRTLFYSGFIEFLFMFALTLLFLSTATFFVLCPFGSFLVFLKNSRDATRKLLFEFGQVNTIPIRYGVSILFLFIMTLLSLQLRSNNLTQLISLYKGAPTFEDKQEIAKNIIAKSTLIREDLVSTYLAQYRFLSDENMTLLKQGYINEVGTGPATATALQTFFNRMALPFMYRGVFEDDVKQAGEDYSLLFDEPIQKGEVETIAKTMSQTNTQDTFKAGILDSTRETVRLVKRNVSTEFESNEVVARVTIEEEYENISRDPQEIYYEFSLPYNSVLDELVLGPDLEIGAAAADKPISTPTNEPPNVNIPAPQNVRIDSATVAPRGAATTVYENSIFRRIDPALLAQVGPRQYKLRIYPIPAEGFTLEGVRTKEPQKNQKVRFSYVTQVGHIGTPLPTYSETRNVFEDRNTKITYNLNGKTIKPISSGEGLLVPLNGNLPCPNQATVIESASGKILYLPHSLNPIFSEYFTCERGISSQSTTLNGYKIAVLVDSSFSNQSLDWKKLVTSISLDELLKGNRVDLYFFNDTLSQKYTLTEASLTKPIQVIPIGQTDRHGALMALSADYNIVFMVTDSSISDVESARSYPINTAPIYVIHPEGKIPPYHDVFSNDVLLSHGQVYEHGAAGMNDYWMIAQMRNNFDLGRVISTSQWGSWILLDNETTDNQLLQFNPSSEGFESAIGKLSQKLIIMDSLKLAGGNINNPVFLDQINKQSQNSLIVTPYSAMIVLVTEAQKRQLAQAIKENNRYELALDPGEEQLNNPSGTGILEVGAVPEPHEWLLIFSGMIFLVYVYRSQIAFVYATHYDRFFQNFKKH